MDRLALAKAGVNVFSAGKISYLEGALKNSIISVC